MHCHDHECKLIDLRAREFGCATFCSQAQTPHEPALSSEIDTAVHGSEVLDDHVTASETPIQTQPHTLESEHHETAKDADVDVPTTVADSPADAPAEDDGAHATEAHTEEEAAPLQSVSHQEAAPHTDAHQPTEDESPSSVLAETAEEQGEIVPELVQGPRAESLEMGAAAEDSVPLAADTDREADAVNAAETEAGVVDAVETEPAVDAVETEPAIDAVNAVGTEPVIDAEPAETESSQEQQQPEMQKQQSGFGAEEPPETRETEVAAAAAEDDPLGDEPVVAQEQCPLRELETEESTPTDPPDHEAETCVQEPEPEQERDGVLTRGGHDDDHLLASESQLETTTTEEAAAPAQSQSSSHYVDDGDGGDHDAHFPEEADSDILEAEKEAAAISTSPSSSARADVHRNELAGAPAQQEEEEEDIQRLPAAASDCEVQQMEADVDPELESSSSVVACADDQLLEVPVPKGGAQEREEEDVTAVDAALAITEAQDDAPAAASSTPHGGGRQQSVGIPGKRMRVRAKASNAKLLSVGNNKTASKGLDEINRASLRASFSKAILPILPRPKDAVEIMAEYSTSLRKLFNQYASAVKGQQSSCWRVDFPSYLNFAKDYGVTPDVVSEPKVQDNFVHCAVLEEANGGNADADGSKYLTFFEFQESLVKLASFVPHSGKACSREELLALLLKDTLSLQPDSAFPKSLKSDASNYTPKSNDATHIAGKDYHYSADRLDAEMEKLFSPTSQPRPKMPKDKDKHTSSPKKTMKGLKSPLAAVSSRTPVKNEGRVFTYTQDGLDAAKAKPRPDFSAPPPIQTYSDIFQKHHPNLTPLVAAKETNLSVTPLSPAAFGSHSAASPSSAPAAGEFESSPAAVPATSKALPPSVNSVDSCVQTESPRVNGRMPVAPRRMTIPKQPNGDAAPSPPPAAGTGAHARGKAPSSSTIVTKEYHAPAPSAAISQQQPAVRKPGVPRLGKLQAKSPTGTRAEAGLDCANTRQQAVIAAAYNCYPDQQQQQQHAHKRSKAPSPVNNAPAAYGVAPRYVNEFVEYYEVPRGVRQQQQQQQQQQHLQHQAHKGGARVPHNRSPHNRSAEAAQSLPQPVDAYYSSWNDYSDDAHANAYSPTRHQQPPTYYPAPPPPAPPQMYQPQLQQQQTQRAQEVVRKVSTRANLVQERQQQAANLAAERRENLMVKMTKAEQQRLAHARRYDDNPSTVRPNQGSGSGSTNYDDDSSAGYAYPLSAEAYYYAPPAMQMPMMQMPQQLQAPSKYRSSGASAGKVGAARGVRGAVVPAPARHFSAPMPAEGYTYSPADAYPTGAYGYPPPQYATAAVMPPSSIPSNRRPAKIQPSGGRGGRAGGWKN